MTTSKIEKKAVKKPARISLRSQVFNLIGGEHLDITEVAKPEEGESGQAAALRVSRKLRGVYCKYVEQARKQTGKKYETRSFRNYKDGVFEVVYHIECVG